MSIEKLKDGYRVRWYEGGKHPSRKLVGATRAEAKKFQRKMEERAWRAELGAGDSRATFGEFLDEWWAKAPPKTENTRRSYEVCLRLHIRPRLGGYPMRELTVPLFHQFRLDLEAAGVGADQIQKCLTVCQAAMRSAVLWGYADRNIVKDVPKPQIKRKRDPQVIDPSEVERVRRSLADELLGEATLYSVLAYAGLRPGEALALSWRDVGERTLNIDKAIAFGKEKGTKTQAVRSVRIVPPLAGDLRAWRAAAPHSSLLFPNRAGEAWADHDYRNWRRRSFKPAFGSDLIPYDLRHSFGSYLIYEGWPIHEVARQMGNSPAVCLKTYARLVDDYDPSQRVTLEERILKARGGDNVAPMRAVGE